MTCGPGNGPKAFRRGFWGKFCQKYLCPFEKICSSYGLRVIDTHDSKVDLAIQDREFKSRGFLNALKRSWSLRADEGVLNEALSLFDNWPGDRADLLLNVGNYLWSVVPGMSRELWNKVERVAVNRGIFTKGGYMDIREHIREEALQKGIQKGMQQGMQARNREIVSNMLKSRLDTSLICKVTGLSEEEIQKLKNGAC